MNIEQPKIIYLQRGNEYFDFTVDEMTWYTNRIHIDDLEYISVNTLLEFINKIENEPFSGVDDFVDQGRLEVAEELLALIKPR